MPPTTSPTRHLKVSASPVHKRASKPVACQRCHSRKVKCSGGHPCSNCRDNAETTPCVYPSRDRQIKLSEQYLKDLLEEHERLKGIERLRSSSSASPKVVVSVEEPPENNTVDEAVRNPLLEDRPWFHAVSSEHVPIHVGEAADAAFATRFRQTLAVGNTKHLPRMDHVQDDYLILLSHSPFNWPSPARARFLVKVALSTVCQYYHIVRKSQVTRLLEEAIKNNGNGDRIAICKILALFALGEVYSAKHASMDADFPGLAFFAQARRMISIPAERPQIDTIEVTLLLVRGIRIDVRRLSDISKVLYSFTVNRRHSAYIFASSACRLGLIMGMNMNIPEHQCPDRLAREHRVRLWWSAYALDRACASKLGLPVSVADEDIMVDFPSGDGLHAAEEGDFGDTEYSLHSIKLAKLAARLTRAIYSRRNHHESFSKRVQAMLKDLTKWMDDLPPRFHLRDNDTSAPLSIVYIHLRFNQCCILATRPILLHVLRSHKQSWSDPTIDPKRNLPDGALALAETCIQCARHTYRMLTEAWINGTLATLDYFDTQYLFSATTILAISSLLRSPRSQADGDDFKNAVELLRQLAQSGNYGAKEFVKHMDAIEDSMRLTADTIFGPGRPHQPSATNAEQLLPRYSEGMTAGMALADPSLRYFLSESDLDLQAFSNTAFDELQTPYWWTDGWGVGGDI